MSATSASVQSLPSSIGGSRFKDTACDVAVAVKASSGVIHSVYCDNSLSDQDAYVQIFDIAAAGVTLGTSVPELVAWFPAGKAFTYTFRDLTNNTGVAGFGTAVAAACTTTPNGSTALTVKPTVEIVFT